MTSGDTHILPHVVVFDPNNFWLNLEAQKAQYAQRFQAVQKTVMMGTGTWASQEWIMIWDRHDE